MLVIWKAVVGPATEYLLVEPSGQVYGVLARRDVDHAFADVQDRPGTVSHLDILGGPDRTWSGRRAAPPCRSAPAAADMTLVAKRGAAVVYPKDAAQIVAFADVFPGAQMLEAGADSGTLFCWLLAAGCWLLAAGCWLPALLWAVGEQSTLVSYERRPISGRSGLVSRAGTWLGGWLRRCFAVVRGFAVGPVVA